MLRFSVLFSLLIIIGCGEAGPKLFPVVGLVTLDGKPIEKAYVSFMPAEGQPQPAGAETDAEGKFLLKTTIGPKDYAGALPGKFNVIITKSIITGVNVDKDGLSGEVAPGGIKTEWIIPEKFSSPKTSGLTFEVKPGMTQTTFDLQSR